MITFHQKRNIKRNPNNTALILIALVVFLLLGVGGWAMLGLLQGAT